jgi:SNF2 family DNA or RNA helicase
LVVLVERKNRLRAEREAGNGSAELEQETVYEFKTKPLSHQARIFDETRDLKSFALLWEQGTGKTKPTIDTAAYLYERGEIDALVVVAPNGVHRNWKSDELPKHLPERLHSKVRCEFWEASKSSNKGFQAKMKAVLNHQGLSIVLFSYENLMTEKGRNFLWKFLRQRKALYVLDESHKIKSPGAKRTKSIVASGRYAEYKRVLTGTPIGHGPFDIYSQLKFLNEDFWKPHGFADFSVFKQHFGDWFTAADCKRVNGFDPGYDKLNGYVNVDQLAKIVDTISDRVLKEDVLDLPPKLYGKRYYELNREQARVYEQLTQDYEAEFADGARIDGSLAITRLLRLHQVCVGYAYTDADPEPFRLLGERNPLLDSFVEWSEGVNRQAIVWARFTKDIDQLMDALGSRACRYDGTLTDDDAERSKLGFQAGEFQWFVGNAQKGATGLTLTQAKSVAFYSNSFNLIDRLQAEDRAHRIGQDTSVDYVDFEGRLNGAETVSGKIISSLRGKFDIAAQVTGDNIREWI